MKSICFIYLIGVCLTGYGQKKETIPSSTYFSNANFYYHKLDLEKIDSVIVNDAGEGFYLACVDLSKGNFIKCENDSIFLKGQIKVGYKYKIDIKDLVVYFWTFDSTQNNRNEFKLKNYYGKSNADGSFILKIPIGLNKPVCFFSNAMFPLCFDYPKFKQSALFKKVQQSKGWVKI